MLRRILERAPAIATRIATFLADHSQLLLRLFGVDEGALVKQEYVDL